MAIAEKNDKPYRYEIFMRMFNSFIVFKEKEIDGLLFFAAISLSITEETTITRESDWLLQDESRERK